MSSEIKSLLKKLQNWEKEYEVETYTKIKDDEISNLFQWQINRDFDELLNFWKLIVSKEHLELEHPTIPKLKTRAILSRLIGTSNFVVFADKNLENPWILGQLVRMVDVVITPDKILRNNSPFESSLILSKLDQLEKTFNKQLLTITYDVKFAGFRIEQPRPYHHFYDQINYLYLLKDSYNKKLYYEKTFFAPEDYKIGKSSEGIYLIPSLMHGINRFGTDKRNIELDKKISEIDKQMENFVYMQLMRDFENIVKKDDSKLTIWFPISVEKRSWIQQNEGFINIINLLKKYFKSIKVYVDGMTAEDGLIIKSEKEEEIFSKLNKIYTEDSSITLISLIGKDYKTKVCYCSTVDIFISSAGTASIIPMRFCKKPGVLHSSSNLWLFGRISSELVKSVDSSMIVDIRENDKPDTSFDSYHIPWEHIYNLTIEVLNNIKDLNIEAIKVPTDEIEKLKEEIYINELFSQEQINKEYNRLLEFKINWDNYFKDNKIVQVNDDPIIHYINNWRKMNLIINNFFDTFFYLEKYHDVKNSKMNPLIHYFVFGKKEGRISILNRN